MGSISKKIYEKYQGLDFDEIFEELEVVKTDLGDFLKITNPFGTLGKEKLIKKEDLILIQELLTFKIDLIPGVGVKSTGTFRGKSINNINDLIGIHPRKYCEAADIINAISEKDISNLKSLSKLKEEELIFCASPDEILFMDIETTGLNAGTAEIFLIGIGFIKDSRFFTEILLARDKSEEAAVLKYFLDLLPKFRFYVSYKGKQFDIPFIRNRIGYLYEPEDLKNTYDYYANINLLTENERENYKWPLSMVDYINSNFVHFDLFYAVRRNYGNMLDNFRLVTVEEKILDFQRSDDLPSSEIPEIYLKWVENRSSLMGGMFKIIEHNFYDVVNMELLLKEWIQAYTGELLSEIIGEKDTSEIKDIIRTFDNKRSPGMVKVLRSLTKKNSVIPKRIDMFFDDKG